MTEAQKKSVESPPTSTELATECHQLIDRLERHPLHLSLLLRARSGLLMVAGYKQNRSTGDRLAGSPIARD